ncbi:MAG TPA: hypothetical protein VI298_18485 [Geobacteraceae bacterium]
MDVLLSTAIANWISALAAIGSASAIWFIWKQVDLLKSQIIEDHKRSRREMAVNLLLEWSRNLKQHSSAARKLVETLNAEQSRCLLKQETFKIDKKYKDLLYASISCSSECKKDCEFSNDEIVLKQHCISNLRWQIICYLNSLEFILSAWRHNIADREIIEEQFEYLINDKEGHQLVHNFRIACGGPDTYPSLENFANHIKEKRNIKNGQGKTGNL